VKSIAFSPTGVLVSGGGDDQCHLLDLRRRKELGNLIEQEGAITAIEFHLNRHMFTASEDRTICVWDTRSWECVKKFAGHRGPVTSMAVHPTGKLMLSTGTDKTVRTWNLIQGRCGFVTNLKEPASLVRWAPGGELFLLAYDKRVDIYKIANCGIIHTVEPAEAINCVLFLTDQLILYGTDSNKIVVYDVDEEREIVSFKAHERRVKSISIIPKQALPNIDSTTEYVICSASSDGFIKLWTLQTKTYKETLIAEIQTKCRPNCLTVALPASVTVPNPPKAVEVIVKKTKPASAQNGGRKKRKAQSSK
jgi:protein MAK11